MDIVKDYIQVDCKTEDCIHFKTCCKVSTIMVYSKKTRNIDLMFVGQGAGKDEDINSNPSNTYREPFCGRAGKYLRGIIFHIWNTAQKFNIALTNTVRCHPVDNNNKDRIPFQEEKDFCMRYLIQDISVLKPSVIMAVGKDSSITLLNLKKENEKNVSMSSLRGNIYCSEYGDVMPIYHPSFLTRTYGKFKEDQNGVFHTKTVNDIKCALNLC